MNEKTSHKPCDLVIFGALGDLSRRKLVPSLYELERAGLIEEDTRFVGVARQELSQDAFRERMKESLDTFVAGEVEGETARRLLERMAYAKVDLTVPGEYSRLKEAVDTGKRVMVNYFSVAPGLFGDICRGLEDGGFATPETRVILEKPIGHDLASSRVINDGVSRIFGEEQIYRIDHYLGKETVLNLVALRFANSLLANNWDHNTIDHVQITVAEEVGIEGRWGYFDGSGQLRDMVQNHLLQILTLVAMEPPVKLGGNSIRDEKLKILNALRPITVESAGDRVVRGQYAAGSIGGSPVPGYLEEEGSNRKSTTETFVALRVDIDNWRWADVPFYLRTGKRMASKRSEVVVSFKRLPHNIFQESFGSLPPNRLILRLQPDEGLVMEVLNKVPGIGRGVRLQNTVLDLSFSEAFQGERIADAYERLLLEAMRGQQAFFIRRDEVERSWEWIDSIQEAWRKAGGAPLPYPAGTMGPDASAELLTRDGREWEE